MQVKGEAPESHLRSLGYNFSSIDRGIDECQEYHTLQGKTTSNHLCSLGYRHYCDMLSNTRIVPRGYRQSRPFSGGGGLACETTKSSSAANTGSSLAWTTVVMARSVSDVRRHPY